METCHPWKTGADSAGNPGHEICGALSPDRSNAVLVLHALTGDAHLPADEEPGRLLGAEIRFLTKPVAAVRFFEITAITAC